MEILAMDINIKNTNIKLNKHGQSLVEQSQENNLKSNNGKFSKSNGNKFD